MTTKRLYSPLGACAALAMLLNVAPEASAQQRNAPDPQQLVASRNAKEQELESIAVIDRKVMVTMRDGKKMAADIYRPKDTSKKYPIIFVRTPYNFNFWDVKDGIPADMTAQAGRDQAWLRVRRDE